MATSAAGAIPATRGAALAQTAVAGGIGGLVGGLAFGAMMQAMDMLPMVAMLVGSESVAVGWIVHLAISAVAGIGFALLAARAAHSWPGGVALGLAYGVVWWVLGALLAMPLRLGMPVFELGTMAWQSLMGHLVFGAVLAAAVVAITRRGTTGA